MRPLDSPEVLVIEDDPDTRELLQEALDGAGFRVHAAASGQAGLQALRENVPDIVLLEQLLPGMSGLEVCRQLRRQPWLGAAPGGTLTAASRATDQVAGWYAGAA